MCCSGGFGGIIVKHMADGYLKRNVLIFLIGCLHVQYRCLESVVSIYKNAPTQMHTYAAHDPHVEKRMEGKELTGNAGLEF